MGAALDRVRDFDNTMSAPALASEFVRLIKEGEQEQRKQAKQKGTAGGSASVSWATKAVYSVNGTNGVGVHLHAPVPEEHL